MCLCFGSDEKRGMPIGLHDGRQKFGPQEGRMREVQSKSVERAASMTRLPRLAEVLSTNAVSLAAEQGHGRA